MIQRIRDINNHKISLGKNLDNFKIVSEQLKSYCMHHPTVFYKDVPPSIPLSSQLYSVLTNTIKNGGLILFNISFVNIQKSIEGFTSFNEANNKKMITEWELSIIINDDEYYKSTIFHNGANELILLKNGLILMI
ncbi:hypothetical protein [Corallibacter sp.]|uniref:hypothetical protein n=1 Tax=Corallibacter sp. TaxID=2038084 RepID=UPI003AB701F2